MPRTGQTAFRSVARLVRDWDGLRREHQDLLADLVDQVIESQEAYLAHYRARQGRYQRRVLTFPGASADRAGGPLGRLKGSQALRDGSPPDSCPLDSRTPEA